MSGGVSQAVSKKIRLSGEIQGRGRGRYALADSCAAVRPLRIISHMLALLLQMPSSTNDSIVPGPMSGLVLRDEFAPDAVDGFQGGLFQWKSCTVDATSGEEKLYHIVQLSMVDGAAKVTKQTARQLYEYTCTLFLVYYMYSRVCPPLNFVFLVDHNTYTVCSHWGCIIFIISSST